MKRTLLFALALAAALPMSAQARDLEYSFVELDYGRMNLDGGDVDPTGFGIKGSVELGESFYFFGGYQQGNDEVAGLDIDLDTTQAGFGWKHAISDKADFNAELSWLHQNLDIGENTPLPGPPCGCGGSGGFIPNVSADADGARLSAGVRGMLSDNFEGWAKANYTDGSDFDGDFSGTLGAQFKFAHMWGITAEAEIGNDYDLYTIGVRASF
jgi:hypothetical protein